MIQPLSPRLEGRVAVITGASRGIGRDIATACAREGAMVVLASRSAKVRDERLPGTVFDAAEEIVAKGGRAVGVQCDITKADQRCALVESTLREFGRVDVLVNNAASTFYVPIADLPGRAMALMWSVLVEAPYELCRLVLPHMRAQGGGWILNITSKSARHPQGPPYANADKPATGYGMCKAAIERLTTGLAQESYAAKVAVNALAPSHLVVTPGALYHQLNTESAMSKAEPVEYIVEAALRLVTGDPAIDTGKIVLSQDLPGIESNIAR